MPTNFFKKFPCLCFCHLGKFGKIHLDSPFILVSRLDIIYLNGFVKRIIPKMFTLEKGTHYPVCVTGRRACPPEDCGGATGCEELLEILLDPSHPEHEDKFNWLPGDF